MAVLLSWVHILRGGRGGGTQLMLGGTEKRKNGSPLISDFLMLSNTFCTKSKELFKEPWDLVQNCPNWVKNCNKMRKKVNLLRRKIVNNSLLSVDWWINFGDKSFFGWVELFVSNNSWRNRKKVFCYFRWKQNHCQLWSPSNKRWRWKRIKQNRIGKLDIF